MELNEFLQGTRLLAHILTVVIVAAYCPDADSARRTGISWFAVLLSGGSAGLGVSTALNWSDWLSLPVAGHLALSLIFCLLLVPVIAGRGNVATLFPRKTWSHRP